METAAAEGGNDPLLNLATQAGTIVCHLRNTPGTTDHTQLCAFQPDGKSSKITQTEILNQLRSTAHAIGEETLGFYPLRNKSE